MLFEQTNIDLDLARRLRLLDEMGMKSLFQRAKEFAIGVEQTFPRLLRSTLDAD